ncbi:tyrosine-type recombinase/integrase [Conexibacter sp. CPCC 206217]|uniref:tyrosine-type recombinase/integrase n=1 Tax=Conexibacter sp. CPCC 206217 TaxID=3064574 RepID=UPI0027279BA2|nr:tyrosine-type recombinase/integrase [Conexibacter sp. CPCC 206217]MDO8209000.1 tyrosine-type recombinase/integrase [Conexibacter sp. CPCC 206217]
MASSTLSIRPRPRTRRSSVRRGRPASGGIKSWSRADGDIGYAIRFRDQHGERQRIRCGLRSEGWSEERAQILLDYFLDQVQRGTYEPPPEEPLDERGGDPFFGEFATDYLMKHGITVSPNTQAFYSNMLRNHLLPEFENARLSEIVRERIGEFRRRRIELMHHIRVANDRGIVLRQSDNRPLKLSEKTINHSIDVLHLVLAEACRRDSIAISKNHAHDPQLHVTVPKKTVRDWLEGDEVQLLFEVAHNADAGVHTRTIAKAAEIRRLREEVGLTVVETARALRISRSTIWYLEDAARRARPRVSQTRTIVALLSASGARNTEICLLRPIDLDFVHHKIRVSRSKTRKGVREIDMTPWAEEQLRAWVDALGDAYELEAPLFLNRRGRSFNKDTLNNLLQRVQKAALDELRRRRLPPLTVHVTAHVFRRTYIAHMLEAGAPLSYVQEQVGHEDSRTTIEIYDRILRTRDRRQHGAAFDTIMRGTPSVRASQETPGGVATS